MAYSSHILVTQGDNPQKPASIHQWAAHSPKYGHVQPSIFAATRSLELLNLLLLSLRKFYHLAHSSGIQSQFFPLPGWLGPSMTYWLELSGNFWVNFFLKKEKHPDTTENIREKLKFCSVIWVCARLEGTTCKFSYKNCQNIYLKFALTQLSARKMCC